MSANPAPGFGQEKLLCRRCGKAVPSDGSYCTFCGSALSSVHVPMRGWFGIVVIAVVVSLGVWALQNTLAGELPTQAVSAPSTGTTHTAAPSASAIIGDSDIEALRKSTEDSPDSLEAWSALTSALLNKIQSSPGAPPNAELLEAVDALKQILRIDPSNQAALLSMAEIAFRGQAFDKATDFYQRYLAERPEDLRARARLGSTYTFMNKPDQAEAELRKVLSVDPEHFEANAYLAIVLTQAGKTGEAHQFGAIALQRAPNEESRAKLAAFLGAPTSDTPVDSLDAVRSYLQHHPIAGSKFIRAERNGAALHLYFRDFPMSAMPEPVREKFVQEVLARSGNSFPVDFIDNDSGAILHSVRK